MPESDRKTRVGQAYVRLKEEIRSNRMPAEFQATEPEIAKILGMSRTPVREALIRLQAEGLVQLVPRRGARVLPLKIRDLTEIYEILLTLEPEAAGALARRRLTAAELQPFEDAMTRMEEAIFHDLDAWALADDDFHTSILELHGNRRMLTMVSGLYDQAYRARTITLHMREPPVQSNHEHREVLRHIVAGDVEAARRSCRAHRERTSAELIALLEKFQLGQL